MRRLLAAAVPLILALPMGGAAVPDLVQVQVEIWYDDDWHDISADVYDRGIRIKRGIHNEGYRADPAHVTLTVNNGRSNVNPDVVGRYSHRNPRSDLYGKIGRNTPIRVTAGVDSNTSVRGVFEVVQWPVRWEPTGRNVWVPVTAAGILRRLGTPSAPLRTTIQQLVDVHRATLLDYWPLDDIKGSTSARSAIGGVPMRAFDADTGIELPEFGSGFVGPWLPPVASSGRAESGAIRATVSGAPTGFAADFLFRAPEPALWGDERPQWFQVTVSTGEDVGWTASINPITSTVQLRIGVGLNEETAEAPIGRVYDGQPHHIRLQAVEAAGNTATGHLYVDGVQVATKTLDIGVATIPAVSAAFARWQTIALPDDPHPSTLQVDFGHLAVWGPSGPSVADAYAAYTGYAGEPAGRRAERLCAENGVPLATVGDLDETMPMGPQRSASLLDLLDECAQAEAGGVVAPILTEQREALGLRWVCRPSLYLTG